MLSSPSGPNLVRPLHSFSLLNQASRREARGWEVALRQAGGSGGFHVSSSPGLGTRAKFVSIADVDPQRLWDNLGWG